MMLGVPDLPLNIFLFPPILWSMLRLRPRDTMFVLAGTSALAVAYRAAGIVGESIGPLITLQMILFGVDGAALLLLGAIAERDQVQMALRESELQLRATFDHAAVGIAHLSLPDKHFLRVNAALCQILGYDADELLQRNAYDMTYGEDRAIGVAEYGKLMHGEISGFNMEKRYVRKDGAIVWAKTSISAVRDGLGPARFAISVVEDTTTARRAEQARRDAERRLALAVAIAELGFWEWSRRPQHVYLSPLWKQQLGYADAAFPNDVREVLSRIHPDDCRRVVRSTLRYLRHPVPAFSIDYRLRHRDGSFRWFVARAAAILDAHDKVARLVGTQLDITQRKETEQYVREVALHDALTGLPNRALVFEFGSHMLAAAQRANGHGALIFIDLDRFKPINDLYGHEVGDRVLQEVARRLLACTRQEDLVGRLGGDEFVIMLPRLDAGLHHATTVARHILEGIGRPFLIDSLELSLSPSIGIAYYPEHGADIDALIHTADVAMYQAKQSGRANYQIYTPQLHRREDDARVLEIKLRHALENRDLALHYQPVMDLQSGRMIGVEALVRLASEEWAHIGPQVFVPIAESAGLIGELGDWVAAEACRQHGAWLGLGLGPVTIAINVSPLQFRQRAFAERLGRIIADSGMDPDCF